MSRFAVLAVLALVGCSDTVAEYNKQKELLVNLRNEAIGMEERFDAYFSLEFPAYAKSKLGFNYTTLSEARDRVARDKVLTTDEKLARYEKIDDDERRLNQFKADTQKPGSPEREGFKPIAEKWEEYHRAVALRDRISKTEQSILALEKRLPR